MGKKKNQNLGGAKAVNVVNRDGEVVRTFGPDESDDRADFIAKAEEFVVKNNAKGVDYEIVPVAPTKKSKKGAEDEDEGESEE